MPLHPVSLVVARLLFAKGSFLRWNLLSYRKKRFVRAEKNETRLHRNVFTDVYATAEQPTIVRGLFNVEINRWPDVLSEILDIPEMISTEARSTVAFVFYSRVSLANSLKRTPGLLVRLFIAISKPRTKSSDAD